jgi:mycothiol synthase
MQAGFRTIYLSTDDHRLPAMRVYLGLGFVPHLWREDMPARWEAVQSRLAAGRRDRP